MSYPFYDHLNRSANEQLDDYYGIERPAPPPKPYRHWFPDYDAALAWEAQHKGIGFTRSRKLGGFEISTTHLNPDGTQRSGLVHFVEPKVKPVKRISLTDAICEEVNAHSHLFRPVYDFENGITELLVRLLDFLPHGRKHEFPLRLTLDEFLEFTTMMPPEYLHDRSMENKSVIITSDDHFALIGRKVKKDDIRILPWTFEIQCQNGDCFQCNQQGSDIRHGQMYGYLDDTWNSTHPEDPNRPLRFASYIRPDKPRIASAADFWYDRLIDTTDKLSEDNLPTSLCVPSFHFSSETEKSATEYASALAYAVSANNAFKADVKITIAFEQKIGGVVTKPEHKVKAVLYNELGVPSPPPIRKGIVGGIPCKKAQIQTDIPTNFEPRPIEEFWQKHHSFIERPIGFWWQDKSVSAYFVRGNASNHQLLAGMEVLRKFRALPGPNALTHLFEAAPQ